MIDGPGWPPPGGRVGSVAVGAEGAVVGVVAADGAPVVVGDASGLGVAIGSDPDGGARVEAAGLEEAPGEPCGSAGPRQLVTRNPNARAPTSAARARTTNPATLRWEIEVSLMGSRV